MSATIENPHEMGDFSLFREIAARLSGGLRRVYAGRHAAKRLAIDSDKSPRTTEKWLDASASPRTAELIYLMARNDQIEQEILRLVHEIRELSPCETNTPSASAAGPSGTSHRVSAEPSRPITMAA